MDENRQKELPDKIVRLDVLRVERGLRKQCICPLPHYEIDAQNRLVYCSDCGAIVDPYDALNKMAYRYEQVDEHTQYLLEERRKINDYKPRLVVIKKLEQKYRGPNHSMIPTCPRCKAAFDLAELLAVPWVNRIFAKRQEENQ